MLAYIVLQRREGLVAPGWIDAAARTHLAFAPTLPSRYLTERLHQVVHRQPSGQRARDLHGEVATRDHDRNAVAVGSVERLIREEEQVLFSIVTSLQHQPGAADVCLFELDAAPGRKLLAKVRCFLLETFELGLQGSKAGRQLRGCRPQGVAKFPQHAFVITDLLLRCSAGAHLDAPNARADAAVV